MEFHRLIWSFAGNEYLEKILTSLTAPLFAHSMLTLLREDKQKIVLDSHRALQEYVVGLRDETAEKVMLDHLKLRYVDPVRFSSLKAGLPAGSETGPDKV